jgi:hypothetical protein
MLPATAVTTLRRVVGILFVPALLYIPPVAHAALILPGAFVDGEQGAVSDGPNEFATAGSASVSLAGGTATASGDLATGEMRAFAEAQAPYRFVEETTCDNGVCEMIPVAGGISEAFVTFRDTLFIDGVLDTPQTIRLTAALDGILTSGQSAAGSGDPSGTVFSIFNWAVDNALGSASESNGWGDYSHASWCPVAPVICHMNTVGAFSQFLTIDALVDDLNRSISITGHLRARAEWGGIANLGNTARLGLLLPDGLSFRSESGVFLSAVAPPPPPVGVAEPSSLGLLTAGLLLVGLRSRRPRAV